MNFVVYAQEDANHYCMGECGAKGHLLGYCRSLCVLGESPMGHRHGALGREQWRKCNRRALIEGLLHSILYRINQAALTLEAGGVGNRAQANAAVAPDDAHRYTVAAKSCSEIVGDGDRHPL